MDKIFTFSESPIKDLWEHLKFLGIENNCKRLLLGEIKSGRNVLYNHSEKLDKKAKQISMCVKQAYEYFLAADDVSITTSPLLYFYGMLSLSKALIIANKQDLFLENIKYHGLETKPRYEFLKEYLEDTDNWRIEDEYAVTNDGVFSYLTEIIDGFTFPKTSVIRFVDLLRITPELWKIFIKYYGERPDILYMWRLEESESEGYSLRVGFKEKDLNNINRIFPELAADFEVDSQVMSDVNTEYVSKGLTSFPDYLRVVEPSAGGRYFTKGLKYFHENDSKCKVINETCCDYLAIYILSICVRYKQDFWGEIISGKSSGILSIIEMYINGVKRRFPNMILNHMFNEQFVYGVSGYLS